MAKSRLELRRMAEAAEKQKKSTGDADGKKTKKRKATKRKTATRKSKDRTHQRKRMVWCVFNGSMKEEGRFPYDQKEAAEAKLEQLRSKSKKLYFLQPVKEAIGESGPVPSDVVPEDEPVEEAVDIVDDEEEDTDEELDVDVDVEALDDEDEDLDDEIEDED